MITKNQKITRLLSILLVFCLTPLYVNAELLTVKANSEFASVQGGGRLSTTGNKQIDVNGNPAPSGTTILSGASLSTPAGVGATVDLPGLGRVNISPNTRLSINYTGSSLDVTVVSGCASLDLTNASATGSLTAPTGETTRTSPNQRHLEICDTAGAAAPIGAGGGAAGGTVSGGLFGLGTTATVALVVASATFAAGGIYAVTRSPCRRGPNPSPGVPRGPNDECRD